MFTTQAKYTCTLPDEEIYTHDDACNDLLPNFLLCAYTALLHIHGDGLLHGAPHTKH